MNLRTITQKGTLHSADDLRELERALHSGLTGTSPIVEEYEAAMSALYGIKHVISVSSGAASVTAALAGVDFRPGDEVIVAPTGPICTVLPILAMGLVPVFCDVAPDSFGLDPLDLRRCIRPRTCAVIEVPMWGYPINSNATWTFVKEAGIPLIQDLAHAHMTRLDGTWLARHGDISCFSTHDCKFISTGEGGFVMTDDDERARRIRAYTRFGNLTGESLGINLKLGGLQAALGLARSRQLGTHLEQRLSNRERLLGLLDNPAFREMPVVPGGVVNGYSLLLQSVGHDGRQLVHYQQRHGIESDIGKYDNQPLYQLPLLTRYHRDCPNAARLLRSLTTVPLHPDLKDDDLHYIAKVLNDYSPN
ncbi:DegT/DnrJ/EryC1/StrS family aminotransferase [Pseudomonas lijiangensis]|uniref:DegT/DnrJ/EryC1/StrS family aminotransferase n=2 Tax=Pseudomonas lijiangensis TaxID=2995658 RepID=A0ABX8HY83_9PSED|nr:MULTISPECIES: DegT/DnrJ/EryC1/StrS family aminotransferase [Pseudomonas syringae group]MBX8499375.1 DegT/DnrJ/EryC1/StrS family aminotransferase [Pseudomonas lijiangensis]MBX8545420.1 DegT/DnrJ/EryC1/StrS family aminotransferase [Pseudomonas cichorii]MBX8567186.1 DegT/DnrJ/EryC1/StrS family aminotransferase [Pseudomonas cichorii]MBX8598168.1 DegT/DnrJ/EryC1/StrS family aminotransferase [Pseudomonas cichorii]QWU84905.1 DegT/DnrJ/EryC1/StrS family aminotransferase [Pseudomonas lijiangensis]